jgi:uncharacterized lipoprotein YddW (UPF0748 family)
MKHCLRALLFGLLMLRLCVPQAWATPPGPCAEMRGLWVVRTSILSPLAIAKVVGAAKSHHFNALFVQVRGRGDAFYQSALEPRAEELRNAPAGFDPLAEVIRQGHAAGLQVHAWLNTCYVWGADKRPLAASHVVNQHPDWLARDSRGHYQISSGPGCEGAFLSPANLAARQHIHDVFLDVATRYDVDGIHFDYVRYAGAAYDYSDAALGRFREEMRGSARVISVNLCEARLAADRLSYPHMFPGEWQAFRRRQVTEMVAAISHDVKAAKPWVIISAAVFADSKDAYSARGQDWKTWLKNGYLDAVVPMAYGASTLLVTGQIRDAVVAAHAAGRYAYAGLGAWHIPVQSTVTKIEAARALGAQGAVLFSYGGMTKDGQTPRYLQALKHQCYPGVAPAPVPAWLAPHPAETSVVGG